MGRTTIEDTLNGVSEHSRVQALRPERRLRGVGLHQSSPRAQRLYNFGARPQRLLWASTGTKDPQASDILYVRALAAPFTVNTMPEGTLLALAGHTELGHIMATDGGECETVLAESGRAGVDVDAKSFVASWNNLMAVIGSKSAALK